MIESDSMTSVELLMSPLPAYHPDLYLLKRCKEMLFAIHWEVSLGHIPRQANTVADKLANMAFTHFDSFNYFAIEPTYVAVELASDMLDTVPL